TEEDCAAIDRECDSGACVDPCVGFACETPPPATCEDGTAVTFEPVGTCSSPGGVPACEYARTETVCESTEVCDSGACVEPCVGVACETPPPPPCEGGAAAAVASAGPGSSPGGVPACEYARTETVCESTEMCVSGACVTTDPCEGVTCDSPPAATCEGGKAVTFALPGTCSDGTCSFVRTEIDCAAMDLECVSG